MKISILTETQKKVLKQVVQTLKENDIQFQITGGLAAILYGVKRPLFDIDMDIHKKDINKLKELFKKHITQDYHHNQGTHFDNWTMVLEINGVLVDFSQAEECSMLDENGNKVKMDTDLSHPTMVNFEGMELPIEPKDELIYYKKILGRETDLADVEQMLNKGEK